MSGYGYDEKHPRSGSMSLAGINTALKNDDVTFDFIDFDACLMATMENALVLGQYADYMIASEETEPGIGWYYTNWLNLLSENTSLPTLEIGRQIVDDFISVCNQKCRVQTAAGGTGSPLPSLMGTMLEGGSTINSADLVTQLLGSLLMGNVEGSAGLSNANTAFLDGRMIETSAQYLTENRFDESQLIWQENAKDQTVLTLLEDQWDLIQNLELNVFYDDGSGYVDLGLDNVFDFDVDGRLIGDYDHTWLSNNGQPVAYYFLDMTDDGENYTINGRVPALLNDQRVDLILTFDNEHPYGYITGPGPIMTRSSPALSPGVSRNFRPGTGWISSVIITVMTENFWIIITWETP